MCNSDHANRDACAAAGVFPGLLAALFWYVEQHWIRQFQRPISPPICRWTRSCGPVIFIDHASGATTDRPELISCLEYLNPGDTLLVWLIDRLGRSITDLIQLVSDLSDRGIQFRSLTEAIDTSTPGGELVFHIFAALAQMERRLLSERTRAGLAAARTRGHVGVRPTVVTAEKLEAARAMQAGGASYTVISSALEIGRSTVRRALEKPT